jgi:hypothetical protein
MNDLETPLVYNPEGEQEQARKKGHSFRGIEEEKNDDYA